MNYSEILSQLEHLKLLMTRHKNYSNISIVDNRGNTPPEVYLKFRFRGRSYKGITRKKRYLDLRGIIVGTIGHNGYVLKAFNMEPLISDPPNTGSRYWHLKDNKSTFRSIHTILKEYSEAIT